MDSLSIALICASAIFLVAIVVLELSKPKKKGLEAILMRGNRLIRTRDALDDEEKLTLKSSLRAANQKIDLLNERLQNLENQAIEKKGY